MDEKAKIVAGITLLGISAFIFYYLTKKKKCEEGQTKCVGTDLYQCQNEEWVLIERNSPQCQQPPGEGLDVTDIEVIT